MNRQLVSGKEIQTFQEDANSISFGALAKAQGLLEKREDKFTNTTDALGRLRPQKSQNHHIIEGRERRGEQIDRQKLIRSSKHAPSEISSKKAVTRRREVIPTTKIGLRDPRFEPLSGPIDEARTQKNYSFLEAYQDSEIISLKSAISKSKDEDTTTELKIALLRMESRKKTQQAKSQRQEVLRTHREKEKELIKQGKKPFYLKKAEQKKRTLLDTFEGMNAKQIDRVIERRRKKKAGRERKGMPEGRRLQGN